jgi:hypothetical protein
MTVLPSRRRLPHPPQSSTGGIRNRDEGERHAKKKVDVLRDDFNRLQEPYLAAISEAIDMEDGLLQKTRLVEMWLGMANDFGLKSG